MATPLHTVSEKFGSKEQLVGQLVGLVQNLEGETDSELSARLMRVSNRKLLVLHERESTLKDKFGSREKLVSSLVEKKLGRTDADLESKLTQYSTGRLLSMARGL
jgi:hypothetical protein